jgi:hypothetical protein
VISLNSLFQIILLDKKLRRKPIRSISLPRTVSPFFQLTSLAKQADVSERLNSVIEFFQGYLGQPVGGFPEPLRTKIIRDRVRIDGRPGQGMKPYNFPLVRKGGQILRSSVDVLMRN